MNRGFTLIEMLVAIGISLLVVGGLIVNYNSYNDTQKLKQSALTLKNNLRLAQTQAVASKKPSSGCTQLLRYDASFTSTGYTLSAQCTQGQAGDVNTVVLPSGITFSPVGGTLSFSVLTGGIGKDAVTVTLAGSTKSYAIQVASNGTINDLGFQ